MNQIKIGAIISYLHRGLSILITLVYTPLMTRLLGQSEYGLYNTVASVISIIALLNLGFGNTYIKYYTVYKAKQDTTSIYKLNGIFLGIFSLIAIVAGLCGVFLSNHLDIVFSSGLTAAEYVIAKKLMLLLSINLAATFFTTVFQCIITAHEQFILLKLLALLRSVVSPLVTIPVLFLGYGSVGMVITMVAMACVCDLLHIAFVIFKLKERFVFKAWDLDLSQDILKYTLLIAIHLLVDQVNWNVDKVLLGRFKGTDAVALYSIGYTMHSYYIEIGITLTGIFTPRVHKIINAFQSDCPRLTRELTDLFTSLGRIQFAILAPIAVGFAFWGKPFLHYWVGAEYVDAYYIAVLLMIPGSIDIIQNIGIEIQRALNLHGFRAAIYAAMAAVNIAISVLLCQIYGAIGCAVGTAISLLLVQGLIINIYYHKKCHIDIVFFWEQILNMGKSLIPPICFGVVVNSIKSEYSISEMLLCLIVFVLIYVVSLYCLGLNGGEKQKIKIILRKAKNIKRK